MIFKLINEIDTSHLTLSKISPTDAAKEIEEKYLKPYLDHCLEIVKSKEEV